MKWTTTTTKKAHKNEKQELIKLSKEVNFLIISEMNTKLQGA